MATLTTLVGRDDLVAVGGGLEDDEQPSRLLYAFPHVVDWLANALPVLRPLDPGTELVPLEQVDVLFHDFVSGEDFAYYERSHSLRPAELGVWELKTLDVRVFGWFPKKGVFVMANVELDGAR